MSYANNSSCKGDLDAYQHQVYAVVYGVILAPGLVCNVLALWVFRVYIRETKKAVVFMMNLAVADLLQVSLYATSDLFSVFHINFSCISVCFYVYLVATSKLYY